MSNPESFIEEVNEEVRRERLFGLMRRWGWVGVVLVLGIVGGAGFNEWRKAQSEAAARALGDALVAAVSGKAGAPGLGDLAQTAQSPEAAALADFLAASAEIESGEIAAAQARLEARAADPALSPAWQDLAALRAVALGRGAGTPPDARRAALAPLSVPGRPYRLLALEELALVEIEAGAPQAALALYQDILADAEATADLQDRARAAVQALGAPAG